MTAMGAVPGAKKMDVTPAPSFPVTTPEARGHSKLFRVQKIAAKSNENRPLKGVLQCAAVRSISSRNQVMRAVIPQMQIGSPVSLSRQW